MMEKLQFRKIIGLGALGASVLALSGCEGDYNPPTIERLQEGGEFFEIQRPDGETMVCWGFMEKGSSGYAGYSWLAVSCDWDNDMILQAEIPAVPNTTLPAVNQLD